ncbi:phosphotransferase [Butyrivibrio sp. LC3010]|uniref:phosphotransferase n=1 Tax=Butyrivibrio sp. LC3010 TaxID=1280680 RepID=UPI0004252C8D|nr:phosphotransferase [Butyrivibrio sp. LC3010]
MEEVRVEKIENCIKVFLKGRIDSTNAPEFDAVIKESVPDDGDVIIDAGELEYISSAGLRVILHIIKKHKNIKMINVGSEIYEILDMTGFNQMMTVEKAYKQVSVEGCEVIGKGANGTLYRIDKDNVVKVYNDPNALDDIHHEREVARLALVLGIPTAISYDVVKVGDSYGSVFELLNAKSFSSIIASEPDKFDWCVDEFADLLKKIHSTEVAPGKLPRIKDTVLKWVDFTKDYIDDAHYQKLKALVEAVPDTDFMIHGDYHTNNVEFQNDEVILIDMDTLAVGHPIFELGSIYNAFVGFYELDKDSILDFLGYDFDTADRFYKKVLAKYLETEDENKINEVIDKARIIGYTRLIRRSIRRGALENEQGINKIEFWKKELFELLDVTDTLNF